MQSGICCSEANRKDLVEYLAEIGFHPNFVKGDDHWYLSPLRVENTPSLKVSKRLNLWYDHGMGKGGNLVDFGVLFFRCSVRELLAKLEPISSFQQQISQPSNQRKIDLANDSSPIKIMSVKPVESPQLISYLTRRKIPNDLVQEYCKQVDFTLYGRQISALGFRNRSRGYELRNTNFKWCSPPKDFTFLDKGFDQVAVFEGFFSSTRDSGTKPDKFSGPQLSLFSGKSAFEAGKPPSDKSVSGQRSSRQREYYHGSKMGKPVPRSKSSIRPF